MKGQSVVFSKGKDNWQTPPSLFNELNNEFDFTLDGAADASNHFCDKWLGPGSEQENALDWYLADQRVFVNPPYSKVKEFVKWASFQVTETSGNKVVMLIPSRTDTKWWHEYVWDREKHQPRENVQVRFIKGRVKFINPDGPLLRGTTMNGSNNSAPFPSVIVVFS